MHASYVHLTEADLKRELAAAPESQASNSQLLLNGYNRSQAQKNKFEETYQPFSFLFVYLFIYIVSYLEVPVGSPLGGGDVTISV